jgi:hypothetical protein
VAVEATRKTISYHASFPKANEPAFPDHRRVAVLRGQPSGEGTSWFRRAQTAHKGAVVEEREGGWVSSLQNAIFASCGPLIGRWRPAFDRTGAPLSELRSKVGCKP